MENKELKIEYIDVNCLTHYNKNSKIHTKEQIKHIANSIIEFGFNDPIGIAGDDNIVLEGNERIEAAKYLGITKLPCVRLDHLSDKERDAYVIAHNSTNLETGFDDGVLYEELKKLQEYDFRDFGLEAEKYLQTIVRVQKRILKQINKIHYLISGDINKNNEIIYFIDKIRKIEGVEIESTTN